MTIRPPVVKYIDHSVEFIAVEPTNGRCGWCGIGIGQTTFQTDLVRDTVSVWWNKGRKKINVGTKQERWVRCYFRHAKIQKRDILRTDQRVFTHHEQVLAKHDVEYPDGHTEQVRLCASCGDDYDRGYRWYGRFSNRTILLDPLGENGDEGESDRVPGRA